MVLVTLPMLVIAFNFHSLSLFTVFSLLLPLIAIITYKVTALACEKRLLSDKVSVEKKYVICTYVTGYSFTVINTIRCILDDAAALSKIHHLITYFRCL